MHDNKIDTDKKLGLFLAGVTSLGVGMLFFFPGIIFLIRGLKNLITQQVYPEPEIIFLVSFILLIGSILIMLSVKFFNGKIEQQTFSNPVLIFASSFFVLISAVITTMAYIYHVIPSGYQTGRAIGGSGAIGVIGLWAAYKRFKKSTQQVRPTHH